MFKGFEQAVHIDMAKEANFVPVIEAGSFQSPIVHSKTSDPDNVQRGVRCGAETGDIPCVGWYFRFKKSDVHNFDLNTVLPRG